MRGATNSLDSPTVLPTLDNKVHLATYVGIPVQSTYTESKRSGRAPIYLAQHERASMSWSKWYAGSPPGTR
jgi:hypothetical protein